jgi:MbtH protein
MVAGEQQEEMQFDVVVNIEQQYSIWSADMVPPEGWQRVGKKGSRQDCVAYIDNVWTDMRPLSLRQQMDATGE